MKTLCSVKKKGFRLGGKQPRVKNFTRKHIGERVVGVDKRFVGKQLKHGSQLGCRPGCHFPASGKVFVAHLLGTNLWLVFNRLGKCLSACASCFSGKELHIKSDVVPNDGVGGFNHQAKDFKGLGNGNAVHLCELCINPVNLLCGFGDLEAYRLDVRTKVYGLTLDSDSGG